MLQFRGALDQYRACRRAVSIECIRAATEKIICRLLHSRHASGRIVLVALRYPDQQCLTGAC